MTFAVRVARGGYIFRASAGTRRAFRSMHRTPKRKVEATNPESYVFKKESKEVDPVEQAKVRVNAQYDIPGQYRTGYKRRYFKGIRSSKFNPMSIRQNRLAVQRDFRNAVKKGDLDEELARKRGAPDEELARIRGASDEELARILAQYNRIVL